MHLSVFIDQRLSSLERVLLVDTALTAAAAPACGHALEPLTSCSVHLLMIQAHRNESILIRILIRIRIYPRLHMLAVYADFLGECGGSLGHPSLLPFPQPLFLLSARMAD